MRDAFETGGSLPGKGGKRWWKVYGVKNTMRLKGVILGKVWTVAWTHYDGATTLCSRSPDCRLCKRAAIGDPVGSRWNAYIAFYSFSHHEECVLHLTEGAAEQLDKVLKEKATLRGQGVELYRKPPKDLKEGQFPPKNAPVIVERKQWYGEDQIVPAFPIIDSIIRMWGVSEAFIARGLKTIAEQQTQGHLPPSMQMAGWPMIPTGE